MASTSNVTLDDLELVDAPSDDSPSASPSGMDTGGDEPSMTPMEVDASSHLSYPNYTIEEQRELLRQYDAHNAQHDGSLELASSQPVKTLLKDRLYVGNLHPTVDEYSLLHVFSKFGKVTKLDFLFHKSGPMKGKPRDTHLSTQPTTSFPPPLRKSISDTECSQMFFSFTIGPMFNDAFKTTHPLFMHPRNQEAQKALSVAHGKLLRGRKLVVTYAQQAPLDQYPGGGGTYGRRPMMETGRPTTLSLIKTGLAQRHEPKTADKIRLMEAKLLQLSSSDLSLPNTPQGTSTLPHHPSLPAKPPPPLPAHLVHAIKQSQQISSSSSTSAGSGSARGSNSSSSQNNSGTPRLPQKPQTVLSGPATPSTLPSLPRKPSQAPLPLKPASGAIARVHAFQASADLEEEEVVKAYSQISPFQRNRAPGGDEPKVKKAVMEKVQESDKPAEEGMDVDKGTGE
ncbi:hypothetical protein BKA70DRAFT_1432527 [Coprinopsis sp. MPI-PUGE-AT-0042]|nr:hypothetical protein BKA70DRAFT_1432527 [Coprinopsis sp. MPI-PUGE-AT-0042]